MRPSAPSRRWLHAFEDPRVAAVAATGCLALAVWVPLVISGDRASPFFMASHAIPRGAAGSWIHGIGSVSAMWILMMLAMMLPAMAPMIGAYADVAARETSGARLGFRIVIFGLGYFALWAAYAIAAALIQLALRGTALRSLGGTLAAPTVAASLLLVAGVYQWLPLKDSCLRRCRSPFTFLLAHWKSGAGGALRLGLHHGWFCLWCCIALMGLMFVFGTMKLWGMVALAAYCVAERMLPGPERFGRAVGAILVLAGGVILGRDLF